MEDHPPYDPRSIANYLLEMAWKYELNITHLSLQKIIYFLHERFLKETGTPLCKGYFVAWKHGPVHPQIWSTFKNAGREPIRHHAYGLDILTGLPSQVPVIENKKVQLYLTSKGLDLISVPAHRLVGLSHLPGSPWDRVTKRSGGQREYGSRISDELMLSSRSAGVAPIRESLEGNEDLYEQPPS
ncbi:type VI toxin-antitoxin system SocA family antitoxin [Novosphingobium cyanobacteriorum]|uniref:type VI toxin-antitoxin system SocA family antitoxin n=1 Tax=Novosphingobium cyanobacteriorum TaxID=3024215 RepID=UPI0034D96F3C